MDAENLPAWPPLTDTSTPCVIPSQKGEAVPQKREATVTKGETKATFPLRLVHLGWHARMPSRMTAIPFFLL